MCSCGKVTGICICGHSSPSRRRDTIIGSGLLNAPEYQGILAPSPGIPTNPAPGMPMYNTPGPPRYQGALVPTPGLPPG